MSDRLAVFNDGRVEQVGTPAEVYENPATAFVAGFVGVSNLLEGAARPGLTGARRAVHVRPEKIRLLAERGRARRAMCSRRGHDRRGRLPGMHTRYTVRGRPGGPRSSWSSPEPRTRAAPADVRAAAGAARPPGAATQPPSGASDPRRERSAGRSRRPSSAHPRPRAWRCSCCSAPAVAGRRVPRVAARPARRRASSTSTASRARWCGSSRSPPIATCSRRPTSTSCSAPRMAGGGHPRRRGPGLPAGLLHGPLRRRAEKALLDLAVLLPLWSSYLVRVYSWKLILAKEGILSWFVDRLGLARRPGRRPGAARRRRAVALGLGLGTFLAFLYVWLPVHDPADRRRRSSACRARCWRPRATWARARRRRSASVILPLALPGVVAGLDLHLLAHPGRLHRPGRPRATRACSSARRCSLTRAPPATFRWPRPSPWSDGDHGRLPGGGAPAGGVRCALSRAPTARRRCGRGGSACCCSCTRPSP